MARNRKPPQHRQDNRPSRGEVVYLDRGEDRLPDGTGEIEVEVPKPPRPGGRKLLKSSRETWGRYWRSAVATQVDDADVHVVERWITAVDEYERALREIRSLRDDEGNLTRLAKGSTGQVTVHPLVRHLDKLESRIESYEARLAIGPRERQNLGLVAATGAKTAAEAAALSATGRVGPTAGRPEAEELEVTVVEVDGVEYEEA